MSSASSLRVRLILFAVIAAVAVSYTGAHYARLTNLIHDSRYQVHVELASSGGLFPGGEVTYRGVPIGTVGSVLPTTAGVEATLLIDRRWSVPAASHADVHDRSAVGEQYIDLVPTDAAGPSLHDGSTIPITQTSVPLQPEDLLRSLDRFVTSVKTQDLSTTVVAFGEGFNGNQDSLGRIIDGTSTLTAGAASHLAEIRQLLLTSEKVLTTQAAQAPQIQSFTKSLASFSSTLAQHDRAIRGAIVGGAQLSLTVATAVQDLRAAIGSVLPLLNVLAGIGSGNLAAIEQTLVAFPHNVASVRAGTRGGAAQFVLQTAKDPQVCTQGYLPPSGQRSTQDQRQFPPAYGIGCTDAGANPRGSSHVP